MRVLFFGAGAFGLPTLEALHAEHEVVAVVTQPDRPAGRSRQPTPTPVGGWARGHGVAVHKVEDVNDPAFVAEVAAMGVEASVVIAFGQKLSPALIDSMGTLAVNLHASLLPKYRGAAPINWAMIDGEAVTGVSVIGLAQRMDAGPMYATAELKIDPRETAGELHDRLAELGPEAIRGVLKQLEAGELRPATQDEAAATKAPKFRKSDGTVNFDQPSAAVRARVHGLTPWPGCRVMWRSAHNGGKGVLVLKRVADHGHDEAGQQHGQLPGTVLADLRIACGKGSLELLEVQEPGGKVLDFRSFRRGHAFGRGDTLCAI